MDVFEEPERTSWILCHDCVVKFLETFPALAVDIPLGSHPSRTEAPCCPWSYRSDWTVDPAGELFLPDNQGNWKRVS